MAYFSLNYVAFCSYVGKVHEQSEEKQFTQARLKRLQSISCLNYHQQNTQEKGDQAQILEKEDEAQILEK